MDTQGIDQMLSVLRATAAQAGGRTTEAQSPPAGGADFAQILQNSIAQVSKRRAKWPRASPPGRAMSIFRT